jgi:putative ABC transport system permease protein
VEHINSIRFTELFASLTVVLMVAFMVIGSQTVKAAQSNPSEILKRE